MAISSLQVTVGAVATALGEQGDTDASPASSVWAHNAGESTAWVGGPDVSVGGGIPLEPGDTIELQGVMAGSRLYAVAEADCPVNVMQVGV